jgi:hypothetical protein
MGERDMDVDVYRDGLHRITPQSTWMQDMP